MLKKHSGGIPPKIEMYIRIQIARLHKNKFVSNSRARRPFSGPRSFLFRTLL